MHASELHPPIFIAHEPQIPSLHERLKVRVGSTSLLIFTNASSTIGPHLKTKYFSDLPCKQITALHYTYLGQFHKFEDGVYPQLDPDSIGKWQIF